MRTAGLGTSRTFRIVHAALMGGLALIGATFVAVNAIVGAVGLIPVPGVVFALIGLVQLAFAFAVLRRRVPSRPTGQPVDDYWSNNAVQTTALALWAVIEGGGLFAWVGYLLTRDPAPAVVGVLGLIALFLARPAQLEQDGS